MENISLENRNRFNDQFVKYLFADEENKKFTLSFVNSVFEYDKSQQLSDLNFINTELHSKNKDDKWSLLDVNVISPDGIKVNIEIQDKIYRAMAERSIYYWAKSVKLIKNGEYESLKRQVSINLLNFNLVDSTIRPNFHNTFLVINKRDPKDIFSNILEQHTIEMPKWETVRPALHDMCMLDKWLCYLSGKTKDSDRIQLYQEDTIMSQVAIAEDKFFSDEQKIAAYVRAEKYRNDAIARENFVRDEGINEGKREIVQNMLNDGEPIYKIMKYSGLSEDKINEIKLSM